MSTTPYPWEPAWTAHVGLLEQSGRGLLPRTLKPEMVDEFVVPCGSFTVTVRPKLGIIQLDSRIVFMAPGPARTTPRCSLAWFRRMQKSIGTRDPTHAPAELQWYGVGLVYDGRKVGLKLMPDGTLRGNEEGVCQL